MQTATPLEDRLGLHDDVLRRQNPGRRHGLGPALPLARAALRGFCPALAVL